MHVLKVSHKVSNKLIQGYTNLQYLLPESEYTALANSLLTSVCRLRPGISRVFYCNVHVSNDVDGPQQNGAALNVWAGVQGKLRGWRLLEKSFLFFFFQKTGDLNLEARPLSPVLKTEFSFTCTY